jgi:leucyl aminopeptidase
VDEIAVTTRRGKPGDTEADTRVVGLFEGESLDDERLRALVELGEAKGTLKKVAVTHEDAGEGLRRVLVAGLGKREDFGPEKARVAAAAAAARARSLGSRSLSWGAPGGEGVAGALVEGTLLKLYAFERYKSRTDEEEGGEGAASTEPPRVSSLEVVGEADDPAE